MSAHSPDDSNGEYLAQRDKVSVPTKTGKPNPQGKGQIGFLRDWDYSCPHNVVTKPAPQLLADYFTSLLVLSASFRFKPAFETDYYLYLEDEAWTLSLISPTEWKTEEKNSAFVGRCVLHQDATWSITPSDNVQHRGPVSTALAGFYARFVEKLSTANPLEDELPVYVAELPYFQRLFAAALSRSLKQSMRQGARTGIASTRWLDEIPYDPSQILLVRSAIK
mgnify:CR=1 FL=1